MARCVKTMKKEDWDMYKDTLTMTLKKAFGFGTRITRIEDDIVRIIGFDMPIEFDIASGEVFVWQRCSNYTGERVELGLLLQTKEILNKWKAKYFD